MAVGGIDEDAAGRRRPDIARTDRGRRADDYRRQTAIGDQAPDFPLGEEFRFLVMADHLFQAPEIRLRGRAAAGAFAESGDAAGINDPFDPGGEGRQHQGARPFDVGGIHPVRIGGPETVIRGDMEECRAPLQGFQQRGPVGKVAADRLQRQFGDIGATAAGADQSPHRETSREQLASHRRAEKSGGTGNENFHFSLSRM